MKAARWSSRALLDPILPPASTSLRASVGEVETGRGAVGKLMNPCGGCVGTTPDSEPPGLHSKKEVCQEGVELFRLKSRC